MRDSDGGDGYFYHFAEGIMTLDLRCHFALNLEHRHGDMDCIIGISHLTTSLIGTFRAYHQGYYVHSVCRSSFKAATVPVIGLDEQVIHSSIAYLSHLAFKDI